MPTQRYMVVEHPKEDVGNKMFPVHDLLGTYHWTRLDDTHVMTVASYHAAKHTELTNHDKVTMLPSIFSTQKVDPHFMKAGQPKRLRALKAAMPVEPDHSMGDLIDSFGELFGPLFVPKT